MARGAKWLQQCFVGNIFPAPRAVPADAFDGGVSLQLGGRDTVTEGGNAQHTATAGDGLALVDFGAGMEDFDIRQFGGFFQTA